MTDSPPKPKRRRCQWLAGGIVVVLVIGSLVFAWLATPSSPPVVFTTGDGHQITFLTAGLSHVSYSSHPKAYRASYQFLQSYVPASLFKRLPAPRETNSGKMKSRTGAEPLIMLFEVRPIPPFGLADVVKLEFGDSHGRFPGFGTPASRNSTGWEGTSFESFPRRDQTLVVHLTDIKSPDKTVSFAIPNPGYRTDFPDWTSDELPQTKDDSQVVVTLPKADVDSLQNGKPLPFEVTIADPAWEMHLLTSWVEDATGNYGNALSAYGTRIKSNGLSPFEPVWKAKAVLARTDPAVFSAEEKRVLGPFPIPASGMETRVQEPQFGDDTVISSASLLPIKPRGSPAQQRKPTASDVTDAKEVSKTGAPLDHEFRVVLKGFRRNATLIAVIEDQNGRQLKKYPQTIHTTVPGAKHSFSFRFTPKTDTTQVSLTLIVSEPKEYEFFFAPPVGLRPDAADMK